MKDDVKKRLGVLNVLLNCSTEYKYDSSEICSIMEAIADFGAPNLWNNKIEIKVDGKTVFDWNRDGRG